MSEMFSNEIVGSHYLEKPPKFFTSHSNPRYINAVQAPLSSPAIPTLRKAIRGYGMIPSGHDLWWTAIGPVLPVRATFSQWY